MKKKVYIESTIPSYLASRPSRDLITAGHQQITQEWWENRRKDFDIYISQFVIDEISLGDSETAKKRLSIISRFKQLDLTDDVRALAKIIIDAGIIPVKSAIDAAHISVATIHEMQFLLTWNCKHLANGEIIIKVQELCIHHGYQAPIICTPEELMGE